LALAGFALAVEPVPDAADAVDVIAPPRFVSAFGEAGAGEGQVQAALGIALNADDELFFTDAPNDWVQRVPREGKFVDKVATGSFPGGIAIDREGLVYVAMMMDHKISVFRPPRQSSAAVDSPGYTLVREWGTKGTDDGQFDQPGGLCFGLDGSL